MSVYKVKKLRTEADRLCDEGDRLPTAEAWPLYSRAGRLRDEAHLMDERDFYRDFVDAVSEESP